jgi:cellulase/cellobiase CelA1
VPSSPATGGACTATYRLANSWPGGFQGEVTIHNDLAAATSAWTVTFGFPGGQQVTQAWNATVTQSGSAVTAHHASWNGGLAAGASTTFGFQGSGTATESASTVTCTAS